MQPARDIYEARAAEAAAAAARHERAADRYADLRLLAFAAFVGLLIAAALDAVPWPLLLLPIPPFAFWVVRHAKAEHDGQRALLRRDLCLAGIQRLDGDWMGRGDAGLEFLPIGHPYARDLDLFGEGSLFERLCRARTRAGRRALADWLLAPADAVTISKRQAAVRELMPAIDLREDVQVIGAEVGRALTRAQDAEWPGPTRRLTGRQGLLRAVKIASLVQSVALVLWIIGFVPWFVFAGTAVVTMLLCRPIRRQVQAVLDDADGPIADLTLASRLLERLAPETFHSPRLVELQGEVRAEGESPLQALDRLDRMGTFIEARDNHLYHPVSWLLALNTRIAFALEAWQDQYGEALGRWLVALGEVEALVSIATFAHEQAETKWPEVLASGTAFEARALGHPLLPDEHCVRSDVSLAHPSTAEVPQGLLVSGSNMSGKSTLLRSIGSNTVLALAGAPVRAASLRLGPLAVGASLRVEDSLQRGRSRFQAQIERLRDIVDIARGERPLLFLLDEILDGTNSHDRRVGAQAVVHSLLDHGAIGLVTTHDLALTKIATDRQGIRNVHFQDELVDGRMVFDYTLRPGVVTRSNALALMRAVGLEVEDGAEALNDAFDG